MNDEDARTISLNAVAAWLLWSVVAVTFIAFWAVLWTGQDELARGLGVTACVTSCIAAVVTIRRFAARTCCLIRTLHGVSDEAATVGQLHPLSRP